jgi:hypothetical protein
MATATTDQQDLQSLRVAWRAAFGTPPDKYLSRRVMAKALVWHQQCEEAGGFPVRLKRRLRDIDVRSGKARSVSPTLSPGSMLAREWNGRVYHVEVTPDGFRFDGRDFVSLTAIARRITGTNWSGPRFFGLKTERRVG